jgi:hypothetical protein
VYAFVISLIDHNRWFQQIRETEHTIQSVLNEYLEERETSRNELTILWGYGVPSRCFSLRYANAYTGSSALREEINEICPNEWMYDVWGGYVELPDAYEPLARNEDWDVVILPERYIPEDSETFSRLVITDAMTRRYGRISLLLRDLTEP